jgi:tyrosyl-tRNA synthetase
MTNVATYKEQIAKIIDIEQTEVVFNSSWLAPLSFLDVIELASKYTVARMLERDDFGRRYREGLPIGVHEFLYPLIQAYDSVAVRADVELGGTDQKFNLLVGRDIQREYGLEPQVALLMPILEGLDGMQKMSKSLGNYIGITEPPQEIYGKTMSLPDEMIIRYFELVSPVALEEVQRLKEGLNNGSLHPRDAKMRLARELVMMFYDEASALEAEKGFISVFQRKELPEDIPEISIAAVETGDGAVWLPRLMVKAKLAKSTSEAKRMIMQGGVRINEEKTEDPNLNIRLKDGMIIRAGKRRFVRIRLEK